jgi:hypothetical protein
MARALSKGETVDAEEVHFQRFDGSHGVLLGSAAPVFGVNGAVTGAVSIFADITHFKRLEQALRLVEEQRRFIGDASFFLTSLRSTTGRSPPSPGRPSRASPTGASSTSSNSTARSAAPRWPTSIPTACSSPASSGIRSRSRP